MIKSTAGSIWKFAISGRLSILAAVLLCSSVTASVGAVNITTHHYDNLRTGWNQNETILTPSAVGGSQFKLLASTLLDEQVDAQPLLVTNQTIEGIGVRDVIYVATANDSVYAIDALTGETLKQRNLGTPVPFTALPGQCTDNGPNVGIHSTPVIDLSADKMYVIAYTFESARPVYRIHELDLSTLNDAVPAVVVTAIGKLADGSSYTFDPVVSRQRAGLLLANGNVYAAFAGFCDVSANISRGWVLGWKANTLTPLPGNELTVTRTKSPDNFFLTGIWMSGFGLAASAAGDIYFVTGNSDYSGTTFDSTTNIAESVAQLSSDLTRVKSLFTPNGGAFGWRQLDRTNSDFGSGGVTLLPPQPGAPSNLAVAAGKVGQMYLLNADDLTNHQSGNKPFQTLDIGACWCGESYFTGSDGIGRVVSSGADVVRVWKMKVSPKVSLVQEFQTVGIDTGQEPGFFTTVSSNGVKSAVIWALGRPLDRNPGDVKLYAFDASDGTILFSSNAGNWPYIGDANLVPVVANGKVYVASNQTLSIFGLSGAAPAALAKPKPAVDMRAKLASGEHEIYGTVRAINDARLMVEKRDGSMVTVNSALARAKFCMAEPSVGHALVARGIYEGQGMFIANTIRHAKPNPRMWYPDR